MSPTTAEPLNQSAALVDYNQFSSHSALVDAAFGSVPCGCDCEALMARVLEP